MSMSRGWSDVSAEPSIESSDFNEGTSNDFADTDQDHLQSSHIPPPLLLLSDPDLVQ